MTHTETILLIDDDEALLELLAEFLSEAGFQVLVHDNGRSGVQAAHGGAVDLILLDVMMPGMDGWEVCRQLREALSTPIIMLTAKGEEFDKLRGFRLGIDDYITKPFSFAELVARIRAVLSRSRKGLQPGHSVSSGELHIDFDRRRAMLAGQVVELSPKEYLLLEALARRANRTVPTSQLVIDVWGQEYAGESEHVKRYIWALRRKIERDPGDPRHILTERGFGYRFE